MASKSDNFGAKDAPLPDLFDARVTGTADQITNAVAQFDLDVGCRHGQRDRLPDGQVQLQCYASQATLHEIEATGLIVDRGENVSELGRRRQQEIVAGDPFDGGRTAPEGLGRLVGPNDGRQAS